MVASIVHIVLPPRTNGKSFNLRPMKEGGLSLGWRIVLNVAISGGLLTKLVQPVHRDHNAQSYPMSGQVLIKGAGRV